MDAAIEGPLHRYIGASAGCWALYGVLLAGESPDRDMLINSGVDSLAFVTPATTLAPALLVDAFAAQHAGVPSRQAVQSVAVHLLTLYGALRVGIAADQLLWARRRALRTIGSFQWLAPPPRDAALRIRHLFPGGGVQRPCTLAEYVGSVFASSEARRAATIAEWYEHHVLRD